MIRRFPHMLNAESSLWSEFLRQYEKGWINYRYDVHVGDGVQPGPGYSVMTQGLAIALTQKRIDVVAERFGVVWIFEVKVQAALSALGQVMGYMDLYRYTYNYQGPMQGGIVSDNVLPDDMRVYDSAGLRVFLFPEVIL